MKKWYVLLLLLFTSVIFAEGNASLLSGNTFGLFKNALDGAFEVNENGTTPNFSSLKNPYIFGGLSNFNFQAASTETGEELNIPLMLGFYNPGQTPTSYLLEMQVQTASDSIIADGNISQQTATVTDTSEPGITSAYNWITEESNQVFSENEALDISGSFQFIVHSGSINFGTVLSVDYGKGDLENPQIWAEKNREITTLYNYDIMAGTPPPQAELDYSRTESWENPQSHINFGIDLPLYIKSGNTGHFITAGFEYSRIDDSEKHIIEYSEPVASGPTGIFSEEDSSTKDLLLGIKLKASYTLTLPPLIPTHRGNYSEISPWFNYRINIAEDILSTVETRDYTVNMLLDEGNRKVLQSQVNSEVDSTITLADTINGGIVFRHPLYFGLSDSTALGISPALSLEYTQTPLIDPDVQTYKNYLVLNSEVRTDQIDSNGDGVFEQTQITTNTYDSDGQGLAHIASFLFTLPMVVRISPEKWPFEFTLASQIEAGTDLNWIVDNNDTTQSTTETLDSSGNTINTTSTEQIGMQNETSNRFWSDWHFINRNKLGLTFRFPKHITLDVVLNSSNLFDFDNLTIQTVIALP